MKKPTEFQTGLVEQATYLRGRILTAYSQVEFLLADISVKLDLNFPYRINNRIKAVKCIAERSGYEIYKEDLTKVCDELLEYDELRNFMAHGFMILTTDKKGQHELEYRLYQREDRESFNLVTIKTTVPYLRNAVEKITLYVQHAVEVFRRIYTEKKLEI